MSASTNTELGCNNNEEESDVRRGPWTLEEDSLLIHCIARHGEGRWNMLAKTAGLKRTGKSCRLRWLNYLKPDIKRGNLTPQEQLLILELHSKWGNRWSKIAQHLPGRTDNEIKNYWRTRVQKQARQLNIESDSDRFMDALRGFWMPRLLQKMEQNSSSSSSSSSSVTNSVPSLNPPPQRDLTFTHVVAPNNHTNNSYNNHCPDHCFLEFQNPLEISENPSSSSAAAATSEVPPYGYVFENYDDTNSVSYGMEGINLEAFSVMEAFNGVSSSHFDFSQSSSSSSQSDWVLSTIGGGLWNMDGM